MRDFDADGEVWENCMVDDDDDDDNDDGGGGRDRRRRVEVSAERLPGPSRGICLGITSQDLSPEKLPYRECLILYGQIATHLPESNFRWDISAKTCHMIVFETLFLAKELPRAGLRRG